MHYMGAYSYNSINFEAKVIETPLLQARYRHMTFTILRFAQAMRTQMSFLTPSGL